MKTNFFKSKSAALILAFALLMMFNACKKEENSNDGYMMRFKVNGAQVEFKTQASLVAAFGQSGNIFNGVFTGYDAKSNISLQVYDNKAISETTFSGYALVGSSFVGALIGYQDNDGTLYTQGSINSDATIKISEMSSTTVRGTFSGTLKASGKSDIAITNGEFFVWRAN